MISMTTSLRHMAWADDCIFEKLTNLTSQELEYSLIPGESSVGYLARHIVGGAEWYRYILTGIMYTDLQLPTDTSGIVALRTHLLSVNKTIIDQAELSPELLNYTNEMGPAQAQRSMILAEAVLHAAEHRTQIVATLKVHGNSEIDLDRFDLWHFKDN